MALSPRKGRNNYNSPDKRERKKLKARERRIAYTERMKHERDILKRQVDELTAELGRLNIKALSTSSWKLLARRQLEARRNAKTHQRHLCAEVIARAGLIRTFQGLAHDGFYPGMTPRAQKRARLQLPDSELYQVYVDALDELYAQTDEVLQNCAFDTTCEEWSEPKQTWTKVMNSGYFLLADKRVVPFGFEETCETCRYRWLVSQMLHRQGDREMYDKLSSSDHHTLTFKFRTTTRLMSGSIASVLQRIAVRRYQEDNRMVIVWRILLEGDGIFTGMHAEETG
ncbi:unnamed protein product [Phytophthora lilii]|uniref:Unnamed protein product n=1 Tax=Phytophthora lilii TaxID=2077276 RepID=A0A9W6X882_9STRA|nr:unnamed protein product [Phytophthora lilii]